MKFLITVYLLFIIQLQAFSQEKKTVEALEISTPLNIDGVLDEPYYLQAQPARDFVQLQPLNGRPSFQPSEVYVFYDQTALYVGAMLYDSSPDSIFNYFTERDDIGMSDYFGIYFDPYNQGQLAYGFFITPAGVQTDIKAIKSDDDDEDDNWNAVWESKTRISEKGWIVEMKIPYAALRFSDKAGQTWGLNMFRNIRRYNSNNSWNLIDRKVSGFIHQEGAMTGIKNIKPPVRLSFSPYAATYLEFKDETKATDFVYKGGMDVKYGLNESFTLDMMLIPDFGQIQSDDKELNLSPYELYYDEKRQFFTEGTELFDRGGIFYSRRMGSSPKFSDRADDALTENEIIDFSPSETQLVNATKVSGRTQKGWGLGMLNSMSLPSYSTLKDTMTGERRRILVQPLTNYNLSVVDKSLKNNSYISLINSNVSMINDPFSANVTATDFQFRDKAKKYAIGGKAGISTRGASDKENGYGANLKFDKNSGNFQFGISQDLFSDKFNINDLGYLRSNNYLLTSSYIYYQVIEPFWIIREWSGNLWNDYTRMYKPNVFAMNETGLNARVLFKNNYRFKINGGTASDRYDYYEPRVKNRYVVKPSYFFYNLNLNTDQRKPLNFFFHYGGFVQPSTDQTGYSGEVGMNIRAGQRLQFTYELSFNNETNDRGYVDNTSDEDTIYFAVRDINMFQNVIYTSYAFTNKASISIRVRHYWSGAANKYFLQLQNDGSLKSDNSYNGNHDNNYNAFNVDMIFRWIFAPGSEFTLAWKNSIYNDQDAVTTNYFRNFEKTIHSNQVNSLSAKVLYYIDYNKLRKRSNPGS